MGVPARSGMGSSSSFTVGLINVLERTQEVKDFKKELASNAIFVERDHQRKWRLARSNRRLLRRAKRYISFKQNKTFDVEPLSFSKDKT